MTKPKTLILDSDYYPARKDSMHHNAAVCRNGIRRWEGCSCCIHCWDRSAAAWDPRLLLGPVPAAALSTLETAAEGWSNRAEPCRRALQLDYLAK